MDRRPRQAATAVALSSPPPQIFFFADWVTGKDVLDIGCNSGYDTIEIGEWHRYPSPTSTPALPFFIHSSFSSLYAAEQLEPRLIRGIDIDPILISAARRNLEQQLSLAGHYFPTNLPAQHGPLVGVPTSANQTCPSLQDAYQQLMEEEKADDAALAEFLAGALSWFDKHFNLRAKNCCTTFSYPAFLCWRHLFLNPLTDVDAKTGLSSKRQDTGAPHSKKAKTVPEVDPYAQAATDYYYNSQLSGWQDNFAAEPYAASAGLDRSAADTRETYGMPVASAASAAVAANPDASAPAFEEVSSRPVLDRPFPSNCVFEELDIAWTKLSFARPMYDLIIWSVHQDFVS